MREGGSIGAVLSMEKVLKAPVFFLGLSLPEHGYHAPERELRLAAGRGRHGGLRRLLPPTRPRCRYGRPPEPPRRRGTPDEASPTPARTLPSRPRRPARRSRSGSDSARATPSRRPARPDLQPVRVQGEEVRARSSGSKAARPTRPSSPRPRCGPARTSSATTRRPARGASSSRREPRARGRRQPPLDPEEYSWSADGRKLLIFTNTRKVWRKNTRGDYWVLDVATRQAPEARRGQARGEPHVRQVLARRHARRLRPGQRPLGRGARGGKSHAPDLRRQPDDRQRHRRLGQRGGVRDPRRVPLEPERPGHRLLALRLERDRRVLPDQRHGHALPRRHAHPVPQGGHDELRRQDRDRVRRAAGRRRWVALPGDPRQTYVPADGVRRLHRRARPPADEPAPEHQRRLAREPGDRAAAADAPRRGPGVARRRRLLAVAAGQGAPLGQREARLAARLRGATGTARACGC